MGKPHVSAPNGATTAEQQVVAAFNTGRAHAVRLRGRTHTHASSADLVLPDELSACRFGRLPVGARAESFAEYTAGFDLGTQFFETMAPLAARLESLMHKPQGRGFARGGPTGARGDITLLGLLETLYTHPHIELRAVVATLKAILAAPLDRLRADAFPVTPDTCIRVYDDTLDPVRADDGAFMGYAGHTANIPYFGKGSLCLSVKLCTTSGKTIRSMNYAAPHALVTALFGSGSVAEQKLEDLAAKMLRWALSDMYLRTIMIYPRAVLEEIQQRRKSRQKIATFRPHADLYAGHAGAIDTRHWWKSSGLLTASVRGFANASALIDPSNIEALHTAFMTDRMLVVKDFAERVTSAKLNVEFDSVLDIEKKWRAI